MHISVPGNHARHLRLEKLLCLELSRSPSGFFKQFWIQVAVSILKTPHGGFCVEYTCALQVACALGIGLDHFVRS
jgi:hypothetical protein